ncbi:phosphate-starvation-inducible PsiE family protein [Vulcanococcus limneticus]|uniref:phosphate-starvation-inducible PsiE family protein n=1 Tax=Vulcanococcus limneticus TaxID=2170428 RepID=UPI00398BFA09
MGGLFYCLPLRHSTIDGMKFLDDDQFLGGIHNYERQLAKLLALLLAVVIGFAVLELVFESSIKIAQFQSNWFDGGLIRLLDRLLMIFIALEVLQNVTAYLRDQVVQIELVLLTAMTAIARKVIVLPPGTESKPQLMAGFGVIVVGLAAAYWLVKWARRDQQSA